MSRSEFRYNRKRKHYSYLFKDVGSKRKNIILSSKPVRKEHRKIKKNIKLYKHPNLKTNKDVYLIPKVYIDESESFDKKREGWKFHPNDKRIVKRIKKKIVSIEASQLRTLYQLTELIKTYSIIDVNTNEEKTYSKRKKHNQKTI